MRRILLDTDLAMGAPGSDIDDGYALALALADPEITVDLVTTVGGNSDVDTSTRLTHELLKRVDRTDVPVVRGAGAPLDPRWRRPGSAGRDTTSSLRARPSAAAALVERVMAEPGELTIVAIGPLTNVALALMIEPRVADSVVEIVVMGGVYLKHTNVLGMPGEYNFWCDPQAAASVLASGAPLRLVGLDVTEQVRLTRDHTAAMRAEPKRFAPYAAECADGWIDHQQRVKAGDELEHGSCALHDPLAVAAVTHPELVTFQPAHVAVETASQLTRGVAVADLLRWENPPPANCEIAVAVDADAFMRYFLDGMSSLP
ncbi:MAG TPA: nucleoside hydrolase [Nocardioidaceae bacterium]|jgi:purine nucleosidase